MTIEQKIEDQLRLYRAEPGMGPVLKLASLGRDAGERLRAVKDAWGNAERALAAEQEGARSLIETLQALTEKLDWIRETNQGPLQYLAESMLCQTRGALAEYARIRSEPHESPTLFVLMRDAVSMSFPPTLIGAYRSLEQAKVAADKAAAEWVWANEWEDRRDRHSRLASRRDPWLGNEALIWYRIQVVPYLEGPTHGGLAECGDARGSIKATERETGGV